jgi:hypothetical protein
VLYKTWICLNSIVLGGLFGGFAAHGAREAKNRTELARS